MPENVTKQQEKVNVMFEESKKLSKNYVQEFSQELQKLVAENQQQAPDNLANSICDVTVKHLDRLLLQTVKELGKNSACSVELVSKKN